MSPGKGQRNGGKMPVAIYENNLASGGFPSGYSKSVCVRPHALRKLRTYHAVFANDA